MATELPLRQWICKFGSISACYDHTTDSRERKEKFNKAGGKRLIPANLLEYY